MKDEWGPRIKHDGMGCPVPAGTYVRVFSFFGECVEGIVEQTAVTPSPGKVSCWDWGLYEIPEKIRVYSYQVRKPRGMEKIEEVLNNLPLEVVHCQ